MNQEVQKICDQVIENRNALDKNMFWELDGNTCALMAGLLSAARGVPADAEKYAACKKLLHEKTGIFSELQGLIQSAVIAKMTLAEDPEAYLQGVQEVYRKLCDLHKFSASAYLLLAALNIFEKAGTEGADAAIAKLEELYNDLKAKHPFIVDGEDRGFLSMLAASGLDMEEAARRIEETYKACEKVCSGFNPVHSMAQILAFSEKAAEEKAAFVDALQKKLKENDGSISKEYGYPVLGALFLLGLPAEELAAEIAETSEYLKGKDGFKWFDEGKGLRTVYAALIVFLAHAGEQKGLGETLSTGLAVNLIEQIFLLLLIAVM